MSQITIADGTLIVFEGLDATGKSSQMMRIKDAADGKFGHRLFAPPVPGFTHQPSGNDSLGNMIYDITENAVINNAWCRQFLHLASHANHYENHILPMLDSGTPMFMDRCWWSTVAYGYYGGGLAQEGEFSPQEFIKVAQAPTQGRMPSILFLFMDPHKEDPHNNKNVMFGYEMLLATEQDNYPIIEVPKADIEWTTAYIFERLVEFEYAS